MYIIKNNDEMYTKKRNTKEEQRTVNLITMKWRKNM